ncbi:hypothetical protein H6775_00850 [Candidatus Nomurabacteria bacterium]|nr:hypothetical protein [Candidatus Nomurabacteria bacterium]
MIFQKPLFKEVFLTLILVAILHKIALVLFLYWTVDWFDILMHGLGGLSLGFLFLFIFYTSGFSNLDQSHFFYVFFITIGSVLIVGLIWELWEVFVGLTDVLKDQLDTISDIVMDMVGATLSFLYFKLKILKSNNNVE